MTKYAFELTDRVWKRLAPRLPGQSGQRGGVAQDNRQFINAVLWALSTDQPWRCLPAELGNWNSTAKRYRRWVNRGVWETVLDCILDEPEYRWLYGYERAVPADRDVQNGTKSKEQAKQSAVWPWLRLLCRSAALQRKLMMDAPHGSAGGESPTQSVI